MRDTCTQSFIRKPKQKKPLGRQSADGKDNIKMVLKEIRWEEEGMD
jgi:hypothetical protein